MPAKTVVASAVVNVLRVQNSHVLFLWLGSSSLPFLLFRRRCNGVPLDDFDRSSSSERKVSGSCQFVSRSSAKARSPSARTGWRMAVSGGAKRCSGPNVVEADHRNLTGTETALGKQHFNQADRYFVRTGKDAVACLPSSIKRRAACRPNSNGEAALVACHLEWLSPLISARSRPRKRRRVLIISCGPPM